MKKKAAPAEQDDNKKADNKPRSRTRAPKAGGRGGERAGSGMGKYMVGAAVITAITVIVGSLAMGWLQFGRHQALSERLLAKTLATQYSALLADVVRHGEQSVSGLASHPAISSAQTDANGTIIDGALIAALQDARAIYIAPNQVLPPESLSFTARDLLQKARESQQAAVSALMAGKPPLMYTARRTPEGGIVLLEQSLAQLGKLVSRMTPESVHLVLRQSGGQALFTSGEAGRGGEQAIENAAGGIEVVVTVPPGTQDPALLMLFLLIGTGMLLICLLAIVSGFLTAARAIKKDAALLVHFADDLADHSQASPRAELSFPPLAAIQHSLRRLAEAGGARGAPAASGKRTVAAVKETEFVVRDADADLLTDSASPTTSGRQLPETIFREYDIRGVVGDTLTAETVELLGRAIGTEALQAGQQTVIVGRDGRLHSPELADALIQGLTRSGRDVIDIGAAPTPVLYYATHVLDSRSGISLTGSHNPASHNGLKIVIDGVTLTGERIRALRERIARGELASGEGKVRRQDISARYIDDIARDIVLARPMKVAIDCGNGIAGPVAERLFGQLGCEIIPLNMEVDGNFPAHHPDTSKPENYRQLIAAVKEHGADIGLAFDGDGDRLGVVTPAGEIIWPDRLMMLYSRDLLSRTPGADIIFDVKCSRELARVISQNGGRPLMWRTGHSLIKAKLKETGAPLAGEMSGHIFFADRWHGFDDGPYAAARLLEILSLESGDADQVFSQLKTGLTTPELNIPSTDKGKFAVVDKLKERADQFGGSASTIDGLRVDFEDGWGLVRASNTTAVLVARFEGRDKAALTRIATLFRDQLKAIDPSLTLPL